MDFVIDGRGRVLPCEINPRYVHLGDTIDPRELAADGLLVVGAVPRAGMHVRAGPALARMVVMGPLLDAESLRLTPAAVAAIRGFGRTSSSATSSPSPAWRKPGAPGARRPGLRAAGG